MTWRDFEQAKNMNPCSRSPRQQKAPFKNKARTARPAGDEGQNKDTKTIFIAKSADYAGFLNG